MALFSARAARSFVAHTRQFFAPFSPAATVSRCFTMSSTTLSAAAGGETDDKAVSAPSIRKVRIYTRTGDKGSSSLYNGQRRSKDDNIFEALGDVDELNANIGMAREYVLETLSTSGNLASLQSLSEQLAEIQSRLLDLGSAIATPLDSSSPEQLSRVAFPSEMSVTLERWIDEADDKLPPLRNFILPVRRRSRDSCSRGNSFLPKPFVAPFFLCGSHHHIAGRR
jgi:ATP:cob(I)alamin adenosyltransferase